MEAKIRLSVPDFKSLHTIPLAFQVSLYIHLNRSVFCSLPSSRKHLLKLTFQFWKNGPLLRVILMMSLPTTCGRLLHLFKKRKERCNETMEFACLHLVFACT